MLNIEQPYTGKYAFLHLGFRPFFAGGIGFSVLSVILWMLFYFSGQSPVAENYTSPHWHAHEMVFGYSLAVAAGFLLTAIKNWTGIQTLNHKRLLLLFLLWLFARIFSLVLPDNALLLLAIIDLTFNAYLTYAVTQPIVRTKQWKHSAFPGKIALMLIANFMFYLGLMGIWKEGIHYGLYIGFYTILALIFTMGRRVIPFFIEKGVDCPFTPKNWKWLDISSLILFLIFMIADILSPNSAITAITAIILFLLHSYRLYGWYSHGIWNKTLLWILYVGYIWIVFGFLLKAAAIILNISPFLALHSFAYGGIGLITIGMMSRVALGHTGRNVFEPPKILFTIFAILTAGVFVRVVLPLFLPATTYIHLVGTAQLLWIIAFALLFAKYLPMLIKARIDQRPG